MPRIIILGTGTGVGKTYVAERLICALARAQPLDDVVGIKVVETGIVAPGSRRRSEAGSRGSSARGSRRTRGSSDGGPDADGPPAGSDAWLLERVSRGTPLRPHPVRSFVDPVSPHLAARREGTELNAGRLAKRVALHGATLRGWQVVETAGGAFSPLSRRETNLDLAMDMEPSIWVLVAPDALGVLHDVRATLSAMRATFREPDYLVLCAARAEDASAGTNAAELPRVGLPKPAAVVGRDDDTTTSLAALVRKLLRHGSCRTR